MPSKREVTCAMLTLQFYKSEKKAVLPFSELVCLFRFLLILVLIFFVFFFFVLFFSSSSELSLLCESRDSLLRLFLNASFRDQSLTPCSALLTSLTLFSSPLNIATLDTGRPSPWEPISVKILLGSIWHALK